MDSINHHINSSPSGLVVIFAVLVIIIIIIVGLLYVPRHWDRNPVLAVDSGPDMFADLHAPVWQGGYDCPPRAELNVLANTDNTAKPCSVIAPILANSDQILTDTQFLEYMIAHHQVAVNMAKGVLRTSQNQYILELARRMVWQQGYEITMMHAMIGRLPQPFSRVAVLGHYNTSLLSFYKGFAVEPVACYDDMFSSGAHNQLPNIGDREFLTHMIAHHELGLAMSRAQLNRSGSGQSGFMLALLYDIIHDQEQELDRMRGMAAGSLWMNSRVIGH